MHRESGFRFVFCSLYQIRSFGLQSFAFFALLRLFHSPYKVVSIIFKLVYTILRSWMDVLILCPFIMSNLCMLFRDGSDKVTA
jgi:hypothetical protein